MVHDSRTKYRLKFTKSGTVRFIGHLDLMSLFNMSIKRAGLPIAYSEGFNPHQLLSFALPLSLGYYSDGEYLDVVFKHSLSCDEIVRRLNGNLADGVTIISMRELESGEKSAAAQVVACDYKINLPSHSGISAQSAANFIAQDKIIIMKKTKKSVSDADISADILKFEALSDSGEVTELNVLLSAGAERSLRADLVLKALYAFAGIAYPEFGAKFTRLEMYHEKGGKILPLMAT